MKNYLGPIVMLVGVLFFAVPYFADVISNATLWTGLIITVVGFFLHIFINKRAKRE